MAELGTIRFVLQEVPDAFRDRHDIRQWLHKVAQDHGTRIDSLCFVLMTDKALLRYNKTYLRHNSFTDVITFPVESNNGVSGDILISLDRVRENAAAYKVRLSDELHRVMVHGLLHLLGHSDHAKAGREKMRALEAKYLEWRLIKRS